ncbi:ACP S-malonyltransferase [Candidatus Deianiraea vastatrix]|uniref:Malonyl CoA-acyl carrier protein transacylase n=1 Tax=Candidatus Deianiraea vastatrix TaxID=2163644 RepID=A0A5B8XE67_9RICK|nr:ACP S-malonyltransferase [Candidatus Deianiraea vastatrix]QED23530.1 Malonyl CoA-acyl carrier protein transacylase [Candidatus Deianiraea vastatrix]
MIKTTLFAFPGQGSQYIGMGKSVFENYKVSKDVFSEVDDALGYKLSNIIFGDNAEELTATYNAQPALMCVSIAVLRALEQETGKKIEEMCSIVCGHSLGEYSALCASGAITLHDTAKILAIRGKAMNEAAPKGTGGMAAILGASDEQVEELIKKSTISGEVLVIANDNSSGQTVISGHIASIDKSIEVAKELGIKRAVKLPVSGPFHSPLMEKARLEMEKTLVDIRIREPKIPVIANFTATATTNPDEIRKLLALQVTGTVKWRESIMYVENLGYERLFELGAGKVLGGLTKRIAEKINAISIESMDEILANKAIL